LRRASASSSCSSASSSCSSASSSKYSRYTVQWFYLCAAVESMRLCVLKPAPRTQEGGSVLSSCWK
jgi:hypothetical protein